MDSLKCNLLENYFIIFGKFQCILSKMRQMECVIGLSIFPVLAGFLLKYPLKYVKKLLAFPLTRLNGPFKWKLLGREKGVIKLHGNWFIHKFCWKVLPPTFTHYSFKISFVGLRICEDMVILGTYFLNFPLGIRVVHMV